LKTSQHETNVKHEASQFQLTSFTAVPGFSGKSPSL